MACANPKDMIMGKLEEQKQKAQDKVEDMKNKFAEIAEGQKDGINIDPVKEMLQKQLAEFQDYAANPWKILSGVPCACCLPLGNLGDLFREVADAFSEIVVLFTDGAIDTLIAIINTIIEGLSGLVALLTSAFEALKTVGDVIQEVGQALAGNSDASAALQSVESFREAASLKATGDALGSMLESVNKLALSPALQAIIETVGNLAVFIAETPGKLSNAAKNIACGLGAGAMKPITDQLDAIDSSFNADAVKKMLTLASNNKGVNPKTFTSPLYSLDKTFEQSIKFLKMKV